MKSKLQQLAVAILAIVIAVSASSLEAGAANRTTVRGQIFDENGEPMKGVDVVATTPESVRPVKGKTDKKGRFAVVVPDRSWDYEFHFTAEGYVEVVVPLAAGQVHEAVVRIDMVPKPKEPEVQPTPTPSAPPMAPERAAAIPVFNEGVEAWKAGDVETAKAKFAQALEMDPSFSQAHRALTGLAVEQEDWVVAATHAEALLELEPDDDKARKTVYYAYFMGGDFEKAAEAGRAIITAEPDLAGEIIENARALFEKNMNQQARVLAKMVSEEQPENPDALVLYALCCNALGDTAAAKPAFEKYLAIAPEDHIDREAAMAIMEYLK